MVKKGEGRGGGEREEDMNLGRKGDRKKKRNERGSKEREKDTN